MRLSVESGAFGLCALVLSTGCGIDVSGLASTATDSGPAAAGGDATASVDAPESMPESGGDVTGADVTGSDVTRSSDASAKDLDAAGADAGSEASPPPDDSGGCGPGCVDVPPGFTLVVYAPGRSAMCPAGFAQQAPVDLFEGPNVAQACTCGTCGVTAQPVCPVQPIGVVFGTSPAMNMNNPTCPMTGPALPNTTPGMCNAGTQNPAAGVTTAAFVPPPATGGSCTSAGQAQPNSITYASQARTCVPDSPTSAGCAGSTCTPIVPNPYAACIASPGDVPCPPGPLTARHLLGTGATFSCSDCTCTVDATCTGTVTLFNDPNGDCTSSPTPFVADGVCRAIKNFTTYQVAINPPANVACNVTGSSTASSPVLAGERTVCCAP